MIDMQIDMLKEVDRYGRQSGYNALCQNQLSEQNYLYAQLISSLWVKSWISILSQLSRISKA